MCALHTFIIKANMFYIDVDLKMPSFRNKQDTKIVTSREDSLHIDHLASEPMGQDDWCCTYSICLTDVGQLLTLTTAK